MFFQHRSIDHATENEVSIFYHVMNTPVVWINLFLQVRETIYVVVVGEV